MIPMNPAAAAAVALIFIGLHVNASNVDYNNPVRAAKKDEVKISGNSFVVNYDETNNSCLFEYKFYAGYLEAFEEGEPEQFLYYWFLEKPQSTKGKCGSTTNSPVVLLLSGGPGSDSLMHPTGAAGPIRVKDGKVSFVDRQYSLHKSANMLYIEGPVGVGYSYSPNSTTIMESNDESIARATHLALKSFMQKFPRFVKNPLRLVGISFASLYLPTLGGLIDKDPELNLKGIAFENSFFGRDMQDVVWNLIGINSKFMSKQDEEEISEYCCQARKVERVNCDFIRMSEKCFNTIDQMYQQYAGSSLDMFYMNNRGFDSRLSTSTIHTTNKELSAGHVCEACNEVQQLPDCITVWSDFIPLDDETRGLLHVPLSLKRVEAIRYCMRHTNHPIDLVNHLINSNRNITMLFYNSDSSMDFDFMGTAGFIQSLGRKVLVDYMPWEETYLVSVDEDPDKSRIHGYVQQYEGLTYATVFGAGQSSFTQSPTLGVKIFKKFINSNRPNVNFENILFP